MSEPGWRTYRDAHLSVKPPIPKPSVVFLRHMWEQAQPSLRQRYAKIETQRKHPHRNRGDTMGDKTVASRPTESLRERLRYCLDMLYIHDLLSKEEHGRALDAAPHLKRGPK